MGHIIENTVTITAEFCKDRRLVFYPKTTAEAEHIQAAAFDLGFKWNDRAKSISHVDDCVATGMVLRNGAIFHGPKPASEIDGVTYLCTASHMPEGDSMRYYNDRQLMRALFNKISARLDAIEAKVNAIAAELQPRDLDKPSLQDKGRKP